MADSPELKTQKLIANFNRKFGLNETTLRGVLDNATAGGTGANGEYNIEVVEEADGTQTLNITDWDYVPKPSFDPVFENNTPAQIDMVSALIKENNYTSAQVKEIFGWDLQNDTIPITLTSGEVIEVGFLGFNHDDLSDATGKAGISFGMKNCLATMYNFNSVNTNAGGYPASEVRNMTTPTIWDLFPEEWKTVIKAVDKKSTNGGGSYYTETVTTSEKIFLPSAVEVVGVDGLNTSISHGETEGTQYEYWVGKTAEQLIKYRDKDGDGILETATWWMLRSSHSNKTYLTQINITGALGGYNTSMARGLSLIFCV